jgi:hypothetical protein
VTLAYLTNSEGSAIILIVFLAIAVTVVILRLHSRARRPDGREPTEPTLLERIEAMSDEEYEAWRAEGGLRPDATIKQLRAGRIRRRHPEA